MARTMRRRPLTILRVAAEGGGWREHHVRRAHGEGPRAAGPFLEIGSSVASDNHYDQVAIFPETSKNCVVATGVFDYDKVIFADFNRSADLPTGETVAVELLPKEPGEFAFACPMGMFRGRLIIE